MDVFIAISTVQDNLAVKFVPLQNKVLGQNPGISNRVTLVGGKSPL